MRAKKDESIRCKCGPVGRFDKDVAEGSAITSEDFVLNQLAIHSDGYSCPKCQAMVSQLIGENAWRVYTARGWLE
jgi:hypothetical protein